MEGKMTEKEPCEICKQSGTIELEPHTTAEHREDWVNIQDPCGLCGSEAGEPCKPECEFSDE